MQSECTMSKLHQIFMLLSVIIHCRFATVVGTKKLYVKPSVGTNCLNDPCYLLADIEKNATEYLTSNTQVIFLPGHHNTGSNVFTAIQDVHNLSLIGIGEVIINCNGPFGLAFMSGSNVLLYGLRFYNCGAAIPTEIKESIHTTFSGMAEDVVHAFEELAAVGGTLLFADIDRLSVSSISVTHSNGFGLLGFNVIGESTIKDSIFSGNYVNSWLVYLSYVSGRLPLHMQSVLNISDSEFSFGHSNSNTLQLGSGLNIEFTYADNRFDVFLINLDNVTAHSNVACGPNIYFSGICPENYTEMHLCHQGIRLHHILSYNATAGCDIRPTSFHPNGLTIYGDSYMRRQPKLYITESNFMDNEGAGIVLYKPAVVRVSPLWKHEYGTVVATLENVNVSRNSRGGMHVYVTQVTLMNVSIVGNQEAIIYTWSSYLHFKGVTTISGNEVDGFTAQTSTIDFDGTVSFSDNRAERGAILNVEYATINFEATVLFSDNRVERGAILNAAELTTINFSGCVNFTRNTGLFGGAIKASDSNIQFQNESAFLWNTATFGGTIYSLRSNISFYGNTSFISNEVISGSGGIHADAESNLYFYGSATFASNKGTIGGALGFNGASFLHMDEATRLVIEQNYAEEYGGGIYVESCSYSLWMKCFYRVPVQFHRFKQIVFMNGNAAGIAGNAVYGGFVQTCRPAIRLDSIFNIERFHNASDMSLVSSEPSRACFCSNGTFDCSQLYLNVSVYPGELFNIPAVAVGEGPGTTPGGILAALVNSEEHTHQASVTELQKSQTVGVFCKNLSYSIKSEANTEELILTTDGTMLGHRLSAKDLSRYLNYLTHPNSTSSFLRLPLRIYIAFKPCPVGFQLKNGSCDCAQVLVDVGVTVCNISNQMVLRLKSMWIMEVVNSTGNASGIVVHKHCPYDYCIPDEMYVRPSDPDKQCQFDRTGLLCGKCQENLSMVFGSSSCKRCSNKPLLLILPFALMGIVLVWFLAVLNLTVSVGSINGLVLYANILRANQSLFFPHTHSSTIMAILNVFIAWLNLDLGIETCFYDGMDAYAKTWLQVVFPLYIWVIVILMIVSSRYSTRISRLCGRNAVPVLATLFLLSYTKLLRMIITAFSFTALTYPSNYTETLWLYDSNVEYLQGKHIALFVAALIILLVLSAPYTAVLLFAPCLQKKSNYKVLFWMGRLKPLFDAYMGPFKDRYRYWPGLLLLIRSILYLLFSVNVFGNSSLILLEINIAALALLAAFAVSGGVYKSKWINALECFCLMNLASVSTGIVYTGIGTANQATVAYISVGLALLVFVIILCVHTHNCSRSSRIVKSLLRKLSRKWVQPNPGDRDTRSGAISQEEPVEEATVRVRSVRPQFLKFNELREPVLDYCDDTDDEPLYP